MVNLLMPVVLNQRDLFEPETPRRRRNWRIRSLFGILGVVTFVGLGVLVVRLMMPNQSSFPESIGDSVMTSSSDVGVQGPRVSREARKQATGSGRSNNPKPEPHGFTMNPKLSEEVDPEEVEPEEVDPEEVDPEEVEPEEFAQEHRDYLSEDDEPLAARAGIRPLKRKIPE